MLSGIQGDPSSGPGPSLEQGSGGSQADAGSCGKTLELVAAGPGLVS